MLDSRKTEKMKKTIKQILKEEKIKERETTLIDNRKSKEEEEKKKAIDYLIYDKHSYYYFLGFLGCLIIATSVTLFSFYGKVLDGFGRFLLSFLGGYLLICIVRGYIRYTISEKYLKEQ